MNAPTTCGVCGKEAGTIILTPPDETARCSECQAKQDANPRKPYARPAVTDEATFEGLALKCGQHGDECGAGSAGAS